MSGGPITVNDSADTDAQDRAALAAELAALSDRQLLERLSAQLTHSDLIAHEIHQIVRQLEPLIPYVERAEKLLGGGIFGRGAGKTARPPK